MGRQKPSSDQILIELFLDMLAAERGAGINTLGAYGRDLADFSAHLGALRRAVATATTDDVRSYLGQLNKRGFAAASVARRLSAIRQLYRFLYAEGRRGDDPGAILEGPKRGRTVPKVLSIAEVDRLLAAARTASEDSRLPAGVSKCCWQTGERTRSARWYDGPRASGGNHGDIRSRSRCLAWRLVLAARGAAAHRAGARGVRTDADRGCRALTSAHARY